MINTAFNDFLTSETKKEISMRRSFGIHAAWIIQCDGQTLPMDPTPTEKGAHARAKAQFFDYGLSDGLAEDKHGDRNKDMFKGMTDDEKDKQFKAWYKEHCKAVNLIV